MRNTIRSADVVCVLCTIFLFGTFAASSGWNVGLLSVLFIVLGIVLAGVVRSHNVAFAVLCGVIILPASFYYYRFRTDSFPVHADPSSSQPLFSSIYPLIDTALPQREASLLEAMFSGSTTPLASDVKAWMSASGTSYLLGMYGYKIHILWEAVLSFAGRVVPRYIAMVVALAALAAFIIFAGSPLSAARTGIMVALASLAELSGRPFAKRNALVVTAATLVLVTPSVLQSTGFALSFMSLIGIYVVVPRFKAAFFQKGRGLFGWRSHLSASVGINLAILPLAAASYGSFPLVSFASNFLSSIGFGATLVLGMVFAALGAVVPSSAILMASPLRLLLSYELAVSKLFSFIPFAISGAIFVPFVALFYYLALGFWVWQTE